MIIRTEELKVSIFILISALSSMQSVPETESGRSIPLSQLPRDTSSNLGETSSTSMSQNQAPNEPVAGTSSAASMPEVLITLDDNEGTLYAY